MQAIDIRTKQSEVMLNAITSHFLAVLTKGDLRTALKTPNLDHVCQIQAWVGRGRVVTEKQYLYLCEFVDKWAINVPKMPR